MEQPEEEIVYEVIYKDANCQTEVEKKTLKSSLTGRLDERGSVRFDQVGGVTMRKRKLSKSTKQKVVKVVHEDEEKFEPAGDLNQSQEVKKRKLKLSQSTEQKVLSVVHGVEKKFEPAQDLDESRDVKMRKIKFSKSTEMVVHGEEEKFESAKDVDQAREDDLLLNTCPCNERLLNPPVINKKMKIVQSDPDAPEKVITSSPPGNRLREMIVALGKEEEMIWEMRKELGKIQQRMSRIEEKERDCEEEIVEVKRELENLHRKKRDMKR